MMEIGFVLLGRQMDMRLLDFRADPRSHQTEMAAFMHARNLDCWVLLAKHILEQDGDVKLESKSILHEVFPEFFRAVSSNMPKKELYRHYAKANSDFNNRSGTR